MAIVESYEELQENFDYINALKEVHEEKLDENASHEEFEDTKLAQDFLQKVIQDNENMPFECKICNSKFQKKMALNRPQ